MTMINFFEKEEESVKPMYNHQLTTIDKLTDVTERMQRRGWYFDGIERYNPFHDRNCRMVIAYYTKREDTKPYEMDR